MGEWANVSRLTASAPHIRHNMAIMERFAAAATIRQPDDISVDAIQRYLAGKQIGPKTARNHLAAISGFCQFLLVRGVLVVNPAKMVRLRRLPRSLPHYLSPPQLAQAFDLARRRGIYAEVALAAYTGLRMSELRLLRWVDVHLATCHLIVVRGKGGKSRAVPLCSQAIAVLLDQFAKFNGLTYIFPGGRQRLDGRPGRGIWNRSQPRGHDWWARVLQPIRDAVPAYRELPPGTTGRGWHMLRHTFASRLAQAGVDLYRISCWLGHSDIRTTQIYAHLRPGWDSDIEKIADTGGS